jgi:hypothetical protein
MLRDETRVWSIKFPVAPESTNAVDTVHEGQLGSIMDTKKGIADSDEDGIFTPALGAGVSRDRPSALVDPGFGHAGHLWSSCPPCPQYRQRPSCIRLQRSAAGRRVNPTSTGSGSDAEYSLREREKL